MRLDGADGVAEKLEVPGVLLLQVAHGINAQDIKVIVLQGGDFGADFVKAGDPENQVVFLGDLDDLVKMMLVLTTI